MIDPIQLHAEVVDYCARVGVAQSTFGQCVVADHAFAANLGRGRAMLDKVVLAQRFIQEHPEIPPRQFGAVAKAFRARIRAEGSGGARGHERSRALIGEITAGTLEHPGTAHNLKSQPTEWARILDTLGGPEAVAEAASVSLTVLEEAARTGELPSQFHRAVTERAAVLGFELDPCKPEMRALGRQFWRRWLP